MVTHSPDETIALGESLGRRLGPGTVVLLYGPLGAGKTVFVKGLTAGIGADAAEVSSPTFTLIQEYRGAHVLEHVDLYRVCADEVADLGLEELVDQGAIVAIEWPDRLQTPLSERTVVVRITDLGGDEREINIEEQSSDLYSTL